MGKSTGEVVGCEANNAGRYQATSEASTVSESTFPWPVHRFVVI